MTDSTSDRLLGVVQGEKTVVLIDGIYLKHSAHQSGFVVDFEKIRDLYGRMTNLLDKVRYYNICPNEKTINFPFRKVYDWLAGHDFNITIIPVEDYEEASMPDNYFPDADVLPYMTAVITDYLVKKCLSPKGSPKWGLERVVVFSNNPGWIPYCHLLATKYATRMTIVGCSDGDNAVPKELKNAADDFVDIQTLHDYVAKEVLTYA